MTVPSDRGAPGRWDWLAVFGLSALVFAVAHRHGLLSPYIINDDVRQQLFWMARWLDPSLYPSDLLSRYAAAYVPDGVKALYFLAAKGFGWGPIAVSKWLSGALLTVTALAFWGIGRTLEGRALGFAGAGMAWLMPYFLQNISGGLSRAFASPLLALFVLAWMRGQGGLMGLLLVLQAVLIPYMAVLCAGCACLEGLVSLARRRRLSIFPARLWHFAALGLSAALVWRMKHALALAGFGPLATGHVFATWPEFSAAGRLDLYPLPNPFFDLVYWPFERIGLFLEAGLAAGIVSLVVLLPLLVRGFRRAPWRTYGPCLRPWAFLLAGSLTLYVVARACALALFVPDRYVCYSINLLYAMGLAIGLRWGLDGLCRCRWCGVGLVVLMAGLGAWRLSDVGLYDYTADAPLYAAVRRLPKDARLAGNAEELDNVLTFGRRNVLATFELAHPWSLGYWRRYAPRLADQVAAYYAKDPQTVLAVARTYGITHMVVRLRDFTPWALAHTPLFAPFNAQIRALAARPGAFVLLDERLFPATSVAPGVRLVDLRPLLLASRP